MRKAVAEHLRQPEPVFASEVKKKCEKLKELGWFGLIPELWPNTKHYAGGEAVPLVSAAYGSTESWIGANLEPENPPEKVTFTVIPTFAYFEFIPLLDERDDKKGILEAEKPVPLAGVVVGRQYEIVLTAFTGLYRYTRKHEKLNPIENTMDVKQLPQLPCVFFLIRVTLHYGT
ncbi:indole-3-acetic acid-amido synthetase GH3.10-like [Curcuma longa]|uniref:indole-3-acetic acid-amido synthetase GH3.10-like n=1 Tax=Curcuma longa TaxID=136217 RepID=UPI003D9E6B8D